MQTRLPYSHIRSISFACDVDVHRACKSPHICPCTCHAPHHHDHGKAGRA